MTVVDAITLPTQSSSVGGKAMPEEVIGMADMMAIYEVTDRFEIDRETISVPLEKANDGSVIANEDGSIEIIAPLTMPIGDWQSTLEDQIRQLGFSTGDGSEPWD